MTDETTVDTTDDSITVPDGVTYKPTLPEDATFVARYNAMLSDLHNHLFERGDEIWGIGLAGVGKLNVFNLGEPGLAKSLLPRLYTARIAGFGEEGFFDTQINRTTVPEQLFGPMSLSALKEDRYLRNDRRRLPKALVALLDEFFRGSSAILDTGLKVLEERMWDNDGESQPVPLWFAICPSNDCPMDAEFQAIRDRLPLSFRSERIGSDDNFMKMLQTAVKRHTQGEPMKYVTVEEIEAAQKQVKAIEVPDSVIHDLSTLRKNLQAEGVLTSDRSYVKAVQVMQANAFLKGRDEVSSDDFKILTFALWRDPEQIRTIRNVVMELANPMDKEAMELLEEIESISDAYDRGLRDAATNEDKVRQTLEAHGKLSDLAKRRATLERDAKKRGHTSDVLDELTKEITELGVKLKEGFGMPGVDI